MNHSKNEPSEASNENQRGFTLIELLIVVAIIGLIAAIAIPALRQAIVRAHIAAVASECRLLRDAFIMYARDNSQYPNASNSPKFNLVTFDPLRQEQYYKGNPNSRLLGGQADGYDSPDDHGANQEFWLEMSLKIDPSIRFVVADSDDAPLGGGEYLSGIFLFKDGVLTPIEAGHLK